MTEIKECVWNGIYFLFCDDELQYIGKSKNVYSRFIAHKGNFDFDRVLIFPCPDTGENFDDKNLREIEEHLIFLYSPPENTQHCKGKFHKIPFSEKLQTIMDWYAEDDLDEEYKNYGITRNVPVKPKTNSLKDIVEWVIQAEIDSQMMFNVFCKLRDAEDERKKAEPGG